MQKKKNNKLLLTGQITVHDFNLILNETGFLGFLFYVTSRRLIL